MSVFNLSLVSFAQLPFVVVLFVLVYFVSVLHCCIAMLSGCDVVSRLMFVLFG